MSEWKKLNPVEGSVVCVTCHCGAHETLAMKRVLAVGFGTVTVMKGDEQIYSEPIAQDAKEEDYWITQQAEDAAKKDPDHDWRIKFFAPLYESEYQRQGDGHWVLVDKGEGFA